MTVTHSMLYKLLYDTLCLLQIVLKQTRGTVPCATEKAGTAQARACRCRFYASDLALPCALKVKRCIKEAASLLVTRGAGVEELCKGPKPVFRAETSVQTSGLHLVCVVPRAFFGLAGSGGACFAHNGLISQIGCTCALRCLPQRCSACHLRNC
jgi:hypothetical protein